MKESRCSQLWRDSLTDEACKVFTFDTGFDIWQLFSIYRIFRQHPSIIFTGVLALDLYKPRRNRLLLGEQLSITIQTRRAIVVMFFFNIRLSLPPTLIWSKISCCCCCQKDSKFPWYPLFSSDGPLRSKQDKRETNVVANKKNCETKMQVKVMCRYNWLMSSALDEGYKNLNF